MFALQIDFHLKCSEVPYGNERRRFSQWNRWLAMQTLRTALTLDELVKTFNLQNASDLLAENTTSFIKELKDAWRKSFFIWGSTSLVSLFFHLISTRTENSYTSRLLVWEQEQKSLFDWDSGMLRSDTQTSAMKVTFTAEKSLILLQH